MTKFSRDYYLASKAAEMLGCEQDDLIHMGAQGKLPLCIMTSGWSGSIYDPSLMSENYLYETLESVRLPSLVQLLSTTLKRFENKEERVEVSTIRYSPNPENGTERLVKLDTPVTITRSQLFVLTSDIQNSGLNDGHHNVVPLNNKTPKQKEVAATKVPQPEVEKETPLNARLIEAVVIPQLATSTPPKFLRFKDVQSLTGLSKTSIYKLIEAGSFPKQINLSGSRSVGWLESEVIAYNQARISSSRDSE